jgi:N-dimethylarginine dimethylaminohydrolase
MEQLESKILSRLEDVRRADLRVDALASRIEPTSVLMCPPTHFEVKDSKNPFMEGNVNAVDYELAQKQWSHLKALYESLGYAVKLVAPIVGLEDMVFTANQSLPDFHAGSKRAIMAQMKHESRRKEVPHFSEWLKAAGYQVLHLSRSDNGAVPLFEGQGDAIWHPHKRLLWGGYGHRTEPAAYDQVSSLLDVPVIKLELVNPRFYHLDTAFCALDEQTVLICPQAFSADGLALINKLFARVISVSERDANNFACNALALGKLVVLQKGSQETCAQLKANGFEIAEVDTSEFLKSGGSVFCLKMLIY